MLTLNMCDFCSYERTGCGAQTALADLLNPENHDSEHKSPVVACDKYISPADTHKGRLHDSDL